MRPARWILSAVAACLAAHAAATGSEPSAEPLTSIAAVRRLSIADLGRDLQAAVRGTVTVSGSFAVIQDGDAAVEIDATRVPGPDGRPLGAGGGPQDWPPLGAVVEVEGRVGSNGCAPQLLADRLAVTGHASLPPAMPVDVNALFDGEMIFQRVEVRGVAQGVEDRPDSPTTLFIESGGRRLPVRVRGSATTTDLEQFVDADVQVVGVMLGMRNARGEFLAPWLVASGTDAITMRAPPHAAPFDAPEVALDAIARYRPTLSDGHRIRCRGSVTHATADAVYVQHGDRGVRVGLAAPGGERPAVGDVIEVAGFVDMSRLIGGLAFAVWRRIDGGTPPEAAQLGETELLAPHGHFGRMQWPSHMGLYDGRLIRCRAVVAAPLQASVQALAVTLGRREGPRAELLFEDPLAPQIERRLPRDTEIDVTGILQIDLVASPLASIGRGKSMIGQVRLLVRRPEDVVVVRSPPWWTPRRMAVASGGLVAAIAAAAVWVAFLRREVRRQTDRAVAEESARKEAAVQHEAALRERSLIAADLHDTLLQTLTGIGYQVHVCRNADADESPSHLAVAARLVDHAAAQLRSTVWSLRAMPDARQPFAESVARLVELLAAGHPITVAFHAEGSAGPLHDLVARELLLVAQEAVSNAVHHGNPGRLDVSVAVAADAVKLVIRDDGCGFAEGAQPGPVEGHFGIMGMRERIARLGGTIEFATAPGRGTAVVVRVPDPFTPPRQRRDHFVVEEAPAR